MRFRLPAVPAYVRWGLALLIGFRVVLAVAVLGASGHKLLPGFPRYEYEPLPGDAYGYYSAARELISTLFRHAPILAMAAVAALAVLYFAYRHRRIGRPGLIVATAWSLGTVAFAFAALVRENGAPVLGWPLVWSIPLLPLRIVGSLDPDIAFAVGLALSLAFVAVVIVATYALGSAVAGDGVGFVAAALIGLWPVLALVVGGLRGTENGTWQIEVGLSMYTEPLSTALVVTGMALVARRAASDAAVAVAGALLGFAVVVRLSNVLIVVCVVAVLALGRTRAALLAAGAAAAFAPAVLAYYPKGYAALAPPVFPEHPFALAYARDAWSNSLLWHPSVVAIVLPLAVLGTLRVRPLHALLLWSCILTTAALYTVYLLTPLHPRFLFVVLPAALVLCAAGLAVALELAERAFARVPATIERR